MAKRPWVAIIGTAAVVLWGANNASPGTAAKLTNGATETVNPLIDNAANTLAGHAIPAVGQTVGAAKDSLASTNLLGVFATPATAPPVWATPPTTAAP